MPFPKPARVAKVLRLDDATILQLLGDFQFSLGVFVPAHITIGLAQQMMGYGIVRIHAQRVL